jgi:hypothetical protein
MEINFLRESSSLFEVDPLTCPKCSGEMKVISVVFSRWLKIMSPLTAFKCDPIEIAIDQSGRRYSAIPLQRLCRNVILRR